MYRIGKVDQLYVKYYWGTKLVRYWDLLIYFSQEREIVHFCAIRIKYQFFEEDANVDHVDTQLLLQWNRYL